VPHAGTWIEMLRRIRAAASVRVVPHAGTWIEIILTGGMPPGWGRRASRRHVD